MMISEALKRIAPSRTTAMTDRATQLRAEGRDIISLSVGEPDFDTPAHVLDAARAALDAGQILGGWRCHEAGVGNGWWYGTIPLPRQPVMRGRQPPRARGNSTPPGRVTMKTPANRTSEPC